MKYGSSKMDLFATITFPIFLKILSYLAERESSDFGLASQTLSCLATYSVDEVIMG